MTSASTLFEARQALFDIINGALPSDVVFGWDRPRTPAETDGDVGTRRSAWLSAPVDAAVTDRTMPGGWTETWTQPVVIQCLPFDGSGDVVTADHDADEILTLIVEAVEANKRLSGLGYDFDGWSVMCTYSGFTFRSGTIEGQEGYAAGYEVRLDVEATRCS